MTRIFAAGLAGALWAASSVFSAQAAEPSLRAAICPVMVEHFYAVASGDAYVATLSAREPGDYSGSVTLFGQTDAYEVTFNHVRINAGAPLSIRLPHAERVDYVAMDTAGKTGGEPLSCPTFVITRGNDIDARASMPTGAETLATSRGKLPALPCGNVFQRAEQIKAPLPAMYAGSKSATGDVDVLIDSNGNVIAAQVVKSGGDVTLDSVLTTDARGLKFHPAQFLCTPVISEVVFHFSYQYER